MSESDFERGFKAGFEAGRRAAKEEGMPYRSWGTDPFPTMRPSPATPSCGCPLGVVCGNSACPRRNQIGLASPQIPNVY